MRRELRERRAALSPEEQAGVSAAVGRRLAQIAALERSLVVGGYRAIRGEVDIDAALSRLHADGAIGAIPRVSGDRMDFLPWTSASETITGSFGIEEPINGEPVQFSQHDVVLVPLVAFDGTGQRLGQGGGFYDRAIAAAGAGAHTAATNNTSTYFQQATSAAAAAASDTYEKDLEALHAAHRRADAAERHASSMEAELAKLRAENENLRRDRDAHRDAARTNRATAESAKLEVDELKKELDVRKAREARAATLLAAFAHRGAECGRELCKRRVDASVSRLGRPGVIRTGLSMTGGGLREVWEDGEAVRDVAQKLYRLSDE